MNTPKVGYGYEKLLHYCNKSLHYFIIFGSLVLKNEFFREEAVPGCAVVGKIKPRKKESGRP